MTDQTTTISSLVDTNPFAVLATLDSGGNYLDLSDQELIDRYGAHFEPLYEKDLARWNKSKKKDPSFDEKPNPSYGLVSYINESLFMGKRPE